MISASLLLAVAPFVVSDEPTPSPSEITYAIPYGADIDVRDRLIQAEVVRFDGGDFVVATFGADVAANLTARGLDLVPLEGQAAPLWVVPGRHAGEIDTTDVVYRAESGTLLLATASDLRGALAGHGHCGLQPIPRRADGGVAFARHGGQLLAPRRCAGAAASAPAVSKR